MSSYPDYFALPQVPNADGALKLTYGESAAGADAGYASLPFVVGPYDYVTIRLAISGIVAMDQLDLQLLASPKPAQFDPRRNPLGGSSLDLTNLADYATAATQGLPRPENMEIPLLPSSLDSDLEWPISNVLARSSGGVFVRLLTLDVTAFGMVCLRAKADVDEGALLVASILPNVSERGASKSQAGLGY